MTTAVADETRIVCSHADRCAGCPRIEDSYDAQLAAKTAHVRHSVARYSALAALAIDDTRPAAAPSAYRIRAKLIVAPGPRIGLFAHGSDHEVVDIPDCRVVTPALARAAAALRTACANPPVRARGALTPYGSAHGALRAVDLREARDGDVIRVLVTLILDASEPVDESAARAAAQHLVALEPSIVSVAVSVHGGRSPQVLGGNLRGVYGSAAVRDSVGDTETWQWATHGSFVQANRAQAGAIARAVRDELAVRLGGLAGRAVLELFSGSGALGLVLGHAGARVTQVESFAPAVERAELAARAQGISGFFARAEDARSAVDQLLDSRVRYDAIVVNPPRRGVATEVRDAIARLAPRACVYVSCDPDTLARDLDDLRRRGLHTDRVVPFDMMPQTDEVESLAFLACGDVATPTVLYEDHEIVAIDVAPHEALASHAGRTGSLLDRARSRPGCADAVAVRPLETGATGIALFAKDPMLVEEYDHALGAPGARAEYVALVRGIVRAKGSVTRAKGISGTTRYRRERVVGGQSLIRVWVTEGAHVQQVRVHLASLGHPVLGDERHGHLPSNRHVLEKHTLDRLFLHRDVVEFEHPRKGKRCVLASELPGGLRGVLERMDSAN